ncbi:hypothetical protein NPIL_222511 [Nephila pilipes]|uniref:Uncharacterized protein n=2 Tax=Nephila pilipes TaxID=299642 RepID=A0A8X6QNU0_NEPPI|nr:hypothetical protein NPIL_222511 [Nephila pilipes]
MSSKSSKKRRYAESCPPVFETLEEYHRFLEEILASPQPSEVQIAAGDLQSNADLNVPEQTTATSQDTSNRIASGSNKPDSRKDNHYGFLRWLCNIL